MFVWNDKPSTFACCLWFGEIKVDFIPSFISFYIILISGGSGVLVNRSTNGACLDGSSHQDGMDLTGNNKVLFNMNPLIRSACTETPPEQEEVWQQDRDKAATGNALTLRCEVGRMCRCERVFLHLVVLCCAQGLHKLTVSALALILAASFVTFSWSAPQVSSGWSL